MDISRICSGIKSSKQCIKVKGLVKKILCNREVIQIDPKIIYNIGLDILNIKQKKMLLSYMSFSTINRVYNSGKISHTNQLEYYQMIKVFLELGYSIDICSYTYEGGGKERLL